MLTPEQAKRLDSSLFDEEAAAEGAPAAGGEEVPERIGTYRILSLLGEGAMGVVYEAEQAHPRRLVALKVLRAGLASRSAMRRFHREVEVLAHLRHPGIAQIHDAGTHDEGAGGAPYFAMEYLPGARPIHRYAEERRLTIRQRLELFASVCDAVHHGHQKGVIHRDLKPENILVDDEGRAKVIDFGVARATDGDVTMTTLRTDAKKIVGTLQYMSPEQCDGEPHEIDTRSDVYSLGVVLYELLTGHVPYDISHKSIHAAIRLIQEAEPARPSRYRRSFRGSVEAIVLKAIEKDRERRYASAVDLAQDIRRHLVGEPVEAPGGPSLWARVVRWLVRHPLVGTSAACLAIATMTILLTIVVVWYYAHRPHNIVIGPDDREARLISVGGHTLHTWTTGPAGGIKLAELLRPPDDRPLVLIGFRPGDYPYAGDLCAFPATGDRSKPLWVHSIADEDLPETIRGAPVKSRGFFPHRLALADVFDEIPGREIIVAHTGAHAASALRIYSLDGQVLFQVWHDGNLKDLCWLPETSTLVSSGLNAEAFWHQRGADAEFDEGLHPKVVFAIRPRLKYRSREWIRTSEQWGTLAPLWYKVLLPGERGQIVKSITVSRPDAHHPPGSAFAAMLQLRIGEVKLSVFFDESGNEVGERELPNAYRVALEAERVPPPEYFRFGELPPVLP